MSSADLVQFSFPYVYTGETMAIGIVLPLACLLVVGLRFWTRSLQRLDCGLDDWLILASVFHMLGMGICFIYGTAKMVFGYPTPPPPANLSEDEALYFIDPTTVLGQQVEFPFQILMIIAYNFIKMSIVAFYRRLFVVQKRSIFGIVTMTTQVVIVLWSITFILLVIFPCGKEIWANWASTAYQLQFCNIAFTSEYGLAISDIIIDSIIFIIPLPLIWHLRLTLQRKLAVSGIMLLGATAIGASVARLILYLQIIGLEEAVDAAPPDVNLVMTVALWLSLLECGLALIAACLPTLSYFLTRMNVQSALQSVRSVFSLHSTAAMTPAGSRTGASSRSGGFARGRHGNMYEDVELGGSVSSRAKIMKKTEYEVTVGEV